MEAQKQYKCDFYEAEMTKVRVPKKELWRVDEAADFFSVSVQTIYMWCNVGKLSFVKVAGCGVRIPRKSSLEVIKEDV